MASSFSDRSRVALRLLLTSDLLKHSIFFFLFVLFSQSSLAAEPVWLERFDGTNVSEGLKDPMQGPWPDTWEGSSSVERHHVYALVKEGSNVFLRGRFIPGTTGKLIGKKIEWNLNTHPWISWKWRVRSWATGSRITDKKKEDSSASVYVTIQSGLRAYVIKYVWAVDDPLGQGYSVGEWNPVGRLKATVIRSGGSLNEWVTEKRNFVEDFKNLYKKDLPSMTGRAIGVMTEGDGTKTQPEADYDDFQVLEN